MNGAKRAAGRGSVRLLRAVERLETAGDAAQLPGCVGFLHGRGLVERITELPEGGHCAVDLVIVDNFPDGWTDSSGQKRGGMYNWEARQRASTVEGDVGHVIYRGAIIGRVLGETNGGNVLELAFSALMPPGLYWPPGARPSTLPVDLVGVDATLCQQCGAVIEGPHTCGQAV